jgi:hypothetical protein
MNSDYYLRIRDSNGSEENSIGIDGTNVAHARALDVARDPQEIWGDLPSGARDELAFEIVDETGQTVRAVSFAEAAGPMQ